MKRKAKKISARLTAARMVEDVVGCKWSLAVLASVRGGVRRRRGEHVAELKAKILSSDAIDFNGYPGLAYSLDAPKSKALPEGGVVQGRIYHVNDRVYIIYHTGAKKNSLLPDIKKYLGSLKVDGMVEVPTPVPVEAGAGAAPGGWQEFMSQQDGFSVLLPDKPKREVISSDKTMETVSHFSQNGRDGYGVLSFNLKDPALVQAKPEALLEMVKKSILAEQQQSVTEEMRKNTTTKPIINNCNLRTSLRSLIRSPYPPFCNIIYL